MINGLPQIGLDYDDVIYPWFDQAHLACLRAGIAKSWHKPVTWHPYLTYGVSKEDWIAVLDEAAISGDLYHQPVERWKVDLIRRMYNRGYGIHFITARGSFGDNGKIIEKHTRSNLISSGIPYDSLTFSRDKVTPALELGLDYMLDDSPSNFDLLTGAGINAYLQDERWNQDHLEEWYPFGNRIQFRVYCSVIMDKHLRPADLTPAQRAHLRSPSNA